VAADYAGAIAIIVRSYKLAGYRRLSAFVADLFDGMLAGKKEEWTVVPVPYSRAKLRSRGWDQMEEAARELARKGYRIARPLTRRDSLEQKTLDRASRQENAARAYALSAACSVKGKFVLIDDVVTTGATLRSCSRALIEGGAEAVECAAIAAD
jgi:ComF family protein